MAFVTNLVLPIRQVHKNTTTYRIRHGRIGTVKRCNICKMVKNGITSTTMTKMTSTTTDTFRNQYSDRIPEWLLSRLDELSYLTTTPIQTASLTHTLGDEIGTVGNDVVMHAETGSGKTLAYLIPALSAIIPSRAATQALIIVPTPELVVQVAHVARALTAVEGIPVLAVLDDVRRTGQQLRAGAPRIVVGRVETVRALLDSGRLKVELVRVLIVDEFDSILGDDDKITALQFILASKCRSPPRQTILASATVPQHQHFIRSCTSQHWTRPNIRLIALQDRRTPILLRHTFVRCARGRKLGALKSLVRAVTRKGCKSIVFVGRSRDAVKIAENMNLDVDNTVVGIDEDLPDAVRREGFIAFRTGEMKVLISSELAARGLDVPDVDFVFHLDLPADADRYLHRAGRSARAGRNGTSVLLIEDGEKFVLSRMANSLNVEFVRIRDINHLVNVGDTS